jgi:hypothetical protein
MHCFRSGMRSKIRAGIVHGVETTGSRHMLTLSEGL